MSNQRILVTGAHGFLGRHVVPVLQKSYGPDAVIAVSRTEYDLTDPQQVNRLFEDHKPSVVVHLAAYVGGIGANRDFPADFYFRNTLLTAHMFQAASVHQVSKLVCTMGGCSYPARARSPIDESQMWEGYPQKESAGYSSAKKMALVASESYRHQYGLESVVLIPGNLYGEFDNFRYRESHVVPALIRRFYEARLNHQPSVPCWGSGRAVRDFVYAGDVAALFPFFIDEYSSSDPVNLSSGTTTSIKELSESVKSCTGYEGDLDWDTSKPDGQMEKIFDVTRMKNLGLACPTSLHDGLHRTAAWFTANYATQGDGIRL